MSVLVLTLTDTEDGEVEIQMETDETPDLNRPTAAEHKLGILVAALERAALPSANDTPWLCMQSEMLH